jgi:anaerobic ribonucleoside-triphosphate reductase
VIVKQNGLRLFKCRPFTTKKHLFHCGHCGTGEVRAQLGDFCPDCGAEVAFVFEIHPGNAALPVASCVKKQAVAVR